MRAETLPDWTTLRKAKEAARALRKHRYQKSRPRDLAAAKAKRDRLKQEAEEQKRRIYENAEADRQRQRNVNKRAFPEIYALLERPEFLAWYEAETGQPWNPDWECVRVAHESWAFSYSPQYGGPVAHIQYLLQRRLDREAERAAIVRDLEGLDPAQRRSALKSLASPEWRDRDRIREIYRVRDKLNELHPDKAPFHVDHIIPLQGDRVCGLHVHENLRVVPAQQNLSKGNRWYDSELTDEFCWSNFVK